MATAPEYPFKRPLGAFPRWDGAVEFRVWAPRPAAVAVRLGGRDHPLAAAGCGVWEGVVADAVDARAVGIGGGRRAGVIGPGVG